MSYSLFWRSPALPYTQKQTAITVPSGAVVSNAAPIRFTGKGAANYGKIQQENQMRMVENFAGPTAPDYPTVGMTWYDTSASVLKVCIATAPQPVTWRAMNSTQITDVGDGPPTPASLGDSWFSRTGSASGVLYTYTGIGRYPAVTWDAAASGYFPLSSPSLLGAALNTSTFAGGSGSNFDEAYIYGFVSNAPADVDGLINVAGTPTTVPKGPLYTGSPVTNGYVVWDTTNTMVSTVGAGASHFFSVRELGDGRWQYDNNSYWTDFEPVAGMRVVGLVTVATQDTGNSGIAPGITSMTLWADARELTQLTMVPMTLAGGAIGGWNQVWPQIDVGAGRDEYEYVYGLVASLIGDALSFGGSDALGRSIQDLTDFRSLDASMQQKWAALLPNDQNVVRSSAYLNELKVEPNSQDWDKLLAAAKYAINRLELPPGLADDVSPLPFVSDGRPAPAALYALSSSDVRYPTIDRQVTRRPGIVTTMRQYQETINVLQSAIVNRYMLKGIMGTNGVNTTFNSNVSVIGQAAFQNTTGFSGVVTHGLLYRFDFSQPNMQRFFFAGEALEFYAVFTASGGQPVNTDLRNLINQSGRLRLTADNAFVMSNNSLPSLSRSPIGQGYTTLSANTTLATMTVGAATITYRAGVVGGGVVIYIDVLANGATGTFATQWNYISDNESFNSPSPTRVYPSPLAFDPTDKQGSGQFT